MIFAQSLMQRVGDGSWHPGIVREPQVIAGIYGCSSMFIPLKYGIYRLLTHTQLKVLGGSGS